jgi:hypothetical protein
MIKGQGDYIENLKKELVEAHGMIVGLRGRLEEVEV